IAAVVKELQSCIGLKAEKFFLLNHRDLFFRLTGIGEKKSITINLAHGIWLEDGFRTTTDSDPPTFAMVLRKYLSGSTLKSISQHGFDRIVRFEFDSEPAFTLVAELFGSGNIILLQGTKIHQPLTSKSWKARDVKAGREYMFPPESQDPFTLDLDSLTQVIRSSGKDLVRCLATELNLGGVYAEDVCASLGREKADKAAELSDEEIEEVLDIISSFKTSLENHAPHILLNPDGLQTDVLPFELLIHESLDKKEYPGFSLAAKDYFANLTPEPLGPKKSGRELQLERQLVSQKEALEGLEIHATECQELGDLLYANYGMLDLILKNTAKLLAGGNWQAVKTEIEAMENVISFDPTEGYITVRISEDSEAKLDVRNNLNENAAELYDKSKKSKQKAEGAKEAILDTQILLKAVKKAGEIARSPTTKKPTKKFWFDKFRWFLSSENFIVVGGRDTRTNDLVVKKHLKDGDLYAHADANGAPSIVIKEGASATEATLEEACTFAVSFSRAWKGKLASGSAYWVTPDQVSKTPQPGEFVPKGAFIIRGKRNYSKKIDIILAIAMVNIQGADKVMCGPVTAIKAHATEYITFEPGDEKRSNFAKELSDKYNVPIEEIDRALPPGDISVVKD
ncbi:MAG: ribosome rescue protein RqcH, partial [Thermoplasmata archaeon]|nr:ribosome rescue protein RqcH [Thermoplasmata archaeon]